MKHAALDFLACPNCGANLDVEAQRQEAEEIVAGALRCRSCRGNYPIARGVPRLLPQTARGAQGGNEHEPETRHSFGAQWKLHQYGNTTWGISVVERLQVVLHELRWKAADLPGKVILDAGCGNGALSQELANCGATVVALDLSDSVFRAHERCASARLHFVQGNLFFPPFKPGSFDAIYSCGVFHHTPSTRRCFDALVPVLKRDEGSRYFVWLYAPRSRLFNATVEPLMKLTRRMPSSLLVPACVGLSPAVEMGSRLCTSIGLTEYGPRNLRDRAIQLHDLLSPPYVWYHQFDEASSWARDRGFPRVEETDYHAPNGTAAPVLNKYRTVCRPGFGMLCQTANGSHPAPP